MNLKEIIIIYNKCKNTYLTNKTGKRLCKKEIRKLLIKFNNMVKLNQKNKNNYLVCCKMIIIFLNRNH